MYRAPGLFAVMVCLLFTTCSRELEKDDYIRWIQDYGNKLHAQKISSDFVFDLQYQPASYLALLSNKPVSPTTDDGDMQYYVLKIEMQHAAESIISYNAPDITEKQRRIYYYSYLFQNDLYLEEGGKKLPCLLFHFEQAGLNNGTFILGFERPFHEDTIQESTLIIDSPQFGSFPVMIKVSKQNIPLLKI